MPQTELIELIQLAIDGQANAAQQAQLQRLLTASPESRATYESFRALAAELDRVPMVDPPTPMQWRPQTATIRRFPRRYTVAFAYAAAAVVIVAVALYRAVPPTHSAGATMARIEREDWPVVARVSSTQAKMTIRRSGDDFLVEVATDAPFTIDWDRARLDADTFQKQAKTIYLHRRRGATGSAVVGLHLPNNSELRAKIDLR